MGKRFYYNEYSRYNSLIKEGNQDKIHNFKRMVYKINRYLEWFGNSAGKYYIVNNSITTYVEIKPKFFDDSKDNKKLLAIPDHYFNRVIKDNDTYSIINSPEKDEEVIVIRFSDNDNFDKEQWGNRVNINVTMAL